MRPICTCFPFLDFPSFPTFPTFPVWSAQGLYRWLRSWGEAGFSPRITKIIFKVRSFSKYLTWLESEWSISHTPQKHPPYLIGGLKGVGDTSNEQTYKNWKSWCMLATLKSGRNLVYSLMQINMEDYTRGTQAFWLSVLVNIWRKQTSFIWTWENKKKLFMKGNLFKGTNKRKKSFKLNPELL